jgi:hypothetical protein
MLNPILEDMKNVEQIFAYLKGTKTFGITYEMRRGENITGYADASWGETENMKSIGRLPVHHEWGSHLLAVQKTIDGRFEHSRSRIY